MALTDNRDTYSTVEFNRSAHSTGCSRAEKHLIDKYLDRRGKTLEAGTGGGRILLQMKKMGFSSLYGFDFVPGLIAEARKNDATNSICFEVQDAVCLNYQASAFDQVIYLGQIICTIQEQEQRLKALQEAYRILRPGGTALFSFLSFEVRSRSTFYSLYITYLWVLRKLLGVERSVQYLPWLRLGGKPNFRALIDSGPYVYWYKIDEACRWLAEVGFRIVAIGSTHQVDEEQMHQDYRTLLREPIQGILYVVGQK